MSSILLRNARLVLPDRVIERAGLQIDAGVISRLITDHTSPRPPVDREYDLDGLTVYPGFIDVHIHGAVGVDTMDASPDHLRRVASFLATNGITAWLPTLVPAPDADYENSVRSIEALFNETQSEASVTGARVLGVHYEGPFVNQAQCGALRSAYFKTFSNPSDLDSLATITSAGAVHMTTLAPEAGGAELVGELVKRGWVVSIGHTRAAIEMLDQAAAAGARHMTHFMNAMPPLHHRAPGPVGWGLSRDDVTCDFIADGVHLDPLMLKLLVKMKGPERLTLISDAIAAAGSGDGDYQIWGENIAVKNGRTSNHAGSIAGSVITMLDAVRMMLSLGVAEHEVARMAAHNPATLLGVDADRGSLAAGKRADLVVLDEGRKVRMTMIAGAVAYSIM